MNREHLPIRSQEGLAIDELDHVKVDDEVITLRRYRQSALLGSLPPALLYMHGGGFVTGGLETDDYMCREIARQLPVVVLSVKYRLAPEHPFPIGFEDCFKVVEWITSKAGSEGLQVDLSKGYVLGGTSAGGNFTASLAHAMLERDVKPQPTGLLFMASSFCHPDVRPEQFRNRIVSVDEVDDAPGLTVKSIHYFADK